ncbi:hypothetical protein GGF32_006924 [Allomyces javanicus]|nr:hypothetical protein GGF32_006924 [Allomyces javanicus]
MPSLIDELGLEPEAIVALRNTNRRLDMVTILKFVRTIVHEERTLLNFNHISMHMRCLDQIDQIKERCYSRLIAQFDNFDEKLAVYPAHIVRWMIQDWWLSDEQQRRRLAGAVERGNVIRDATEQ